MEALNLYLMVLVQQAAFDAKIMNIEWVYALVFPLVIYVALASLKWFVLLLPMTLPLAALSRFRFFKRTKRK